MPFSANLILCVGALRNIDGDDEVSSGDNNSGFCGPTGDSQTSIVSAIEQVTFSGFFTCHVYRQARFSGLQFIIYFLCCV